MKQTTISVNVYEVGDVLELKSNDINLIAKRRSLEGSRRAMVIAVKQRQDKLFTYKIVTNTGTTMMLTPNEQGNEDYIGHIDLGMLVGEESA